MSMKDALQKDLLLRHLAAQGAYVHSEVLVYHAGGIHPQRKYITDIDVFALRLGNSLNWELILGDCKTQKGQSPANRVLWLRGLMDHFSASSGVIILQKNQAIEVDHKLFAASLGITLIDEKEFEKYDRALVYPDGSSQYGLTLDMLNELRSLPQRFPKFKPFCEYIYSFGWNEENRLDLLRKVIGEAQLISKEVDPRKPEHLALVLDATSVFAVGLAECVGTIFNQYLQPNTLNQLDDALKLVIWGGRSNYEFVSRLRHDLMIARGKPSKPEGALALPSWDEFIQLVRNMLDNPKLAFSVPQLLREAAIDILYNKTFLAHTIKDDLLLLKFAMLVTNYFCRAARFPVETRKSLENEFIKRQSSLVFTDRTGNHENSPVEIEELDGGEFIEVEEQAKGQESIEVNEQPKDGEHGGVSQESLITSSSNDSS